MTSKEVYLDYVHHDTQTNDNQSKTITYEYPVWAYADLYKNSVKILNTIKRAMVFNDDDIRKIDLIFRTAEEYAEIKEWLKDE